MSHANYIHKRGPEAEREQVFRALDWSQSDAALARLVGVRTPSVRYWRLKLGHKPHPRGGSRMALASLLLLGAVAAVADTVEVPIKSVTTRYIEVVQPEGRQAIVYERVNDRWRIWFTKGKPQPGGEAWRVNITNAAVTRVKREFR